MIDRSRILHSQFARHAPKALSRGLSVKPIFYNSRDRPLHDPFTRAWLKVEMSGPVPR